MTRLNDVLKNATVKSFIDSHAALEKAVDDIGLFESESIQKDHDFNREHVISAFFDLPSPAPFSISKDAEYALRQQFFKLLNNMNNVKMPAGCLTLFLRMDKFFSSLLLINYSAEIPLTSMAATASIPIEPALLSHSQEIRKWNILGLPFHILARPRILLLTISIFIAVIYISISMTISKVPPQVIPLYLFLSLFFSLFILLMYIFVPTRLVARLWTQKYHESICVRELVYLLFELQNDQAIRHKGIRRNIQYRLSRIAKYTLSLPAAFFSQNKSTQKWAHDHFGRLAAYIQEHECWLIAPRATTLEDLRRDMEKLTEMYISGNFGWFQWEMASNPLETVESWPLRAFKQTGRIVLFFAPVALMIWLILNPQILSSLNFNTGTITLLLVAWFLLGIDSVLKLGVVSDLLRFAKGLKDLA